MTARPPYPFPPNKYAEQVRHAARYRAVHDRTLTQEGSETLWTLAWLMGDLATDIDEAQRDALVYEIGRTV